MRILHIHIYMHVYLHTYVVWYTHENAYVYTCT